LQDYNRNPKYFEDPEAFNPERFMPYNKEKFNPIANATFSNGPRACPGKLFAFECMMILTAHLLTQFRFKTKPEATIEYVPGLPQFALPISLTVDIVERKKDN